ncbi:MAG TPA: hypothetical protein DCO93_00475 [Clostridiales bacterium]|nr:hypothetical protein [Clostridiales bacterium]
MKKLFKIYNLLLVISILTGMTATAVQAAEFADVTDADYFYPAVQWGVDAGITYGVDENSFNPQGEVSRAQAVTFLWRMAGQPEPEIAETFADVEEGSWYETAVAWAVENEITKGTGEGMFSPNTICDRAMCITFLYRMMDRPLDGIDLTAEIELDENSTMEDFGFSMIRAMVKTIREEGMLSDVPEGSYFELPVFWGVLNGIITEENSGITEENTLFRSADPCVRSEMISFLYQAKLLDDLKNAPAEVYFDENVVPIPQEYFERLYCYYYGGSIDDETGEELLLIVSERASIEAAEAMGEEETEGIGELFRIIRVSENRLHELLCGDMPGIQAFAKDEEGRYYLFCTPTDVRYVRETNEAMNEDIDQWTELNEWANGELINEILDKNSNLTPVNYTNTMLDMYLARIAYDNYTDYAISATEFGELKAKEVDGSSYAEQLLGGNFVSVDYAESPAGEYVTLNFPDESVSYDFFTADENLVRERRDGYTAFYRRALEGSVTNTETMQRWYYAVAERSGKKVTEK